METLPEAKNRFIESWGEMGSQWGINKTMARIHALLMIGDEPLTTEDVMKELSISRGNANMNLRALIDWGLVRRISLKGERKEHFQSEKDVWTMFCRIARERKKREIEPIISSLQECLELAGKDKSSAHFKEKLSHLLNLLQMMDFGLGKLAQQGNNAILGRILKLLR